MVRNLGRDAVGGATNGVPDLLLSKLGDSRRVSGERRKPLADVSSANANNNRRDSSDGLTQLRDTALGGKAGFLTKGKDGEWTAMVPAIRQASRMSDVQVGSLST